MKNEFLTPQEAAERIEAGAVMSIAGAPELLSTLPKGNWIGGIRIFGDKRTQFCNETA